MTDFEEQTVGSFKMMIRHYIVLIFFFLSVALPSGTTLWYMYTQAADQYSSSLSFSVRSEELGQSPLQLLGVPQLSGSATSDTDILYQYLESQKLVELVDQELGLRDIYAKRQNDFIFSLPENAKIEKMVNYWQKMVRVVLDTRTGIITIKVIAFDPLDAQNVSSSIKKHATILLNNLSQTARKDATQFARTEVKNAIQKLTNARAKITLFRNRTQVIDPSADVKGQMGLVTMLQQKLVEALIDFDLLSDELNSNDPRIKRAEQRVTVIQNRLSEEKTKLGIVNSSNDQIGYAAVVGEYEALLVEKDFAEQSYISALSTLDTATAEAQRQSRYLAAHIEPTLSETPEYPKKLVISGLVFIFGFLLWALISLIYYSARDRG